MSTWNEYYLGSEFKKLSVRVLNRSQPYEVERSVYIAFSFFQNLNGNGALLVKDNESKLIEVLIEKSSFDQCSSITGGGALHVTFEGKSGVSIVRSCFTNCTSTQSGSVFRFFGKENIEQKSRLEFCSICGIESSFVDATRSDYMDLFIKSLNSSNIKIMRVSGLSLISSNIFCSLSNFCESIQDECCFYFLNMISAFSMCNLCNNNQSNLLYYSGIIFNELYCFSEFFKCTFANNIGPTFKTTHDSSYFYCSFCIFDSTVDSRVSCIECTSEKLTILNILPNHYYCLRLIPSHFSEVKFHYKALILSLLMKFVFNENLYGNRDVNRK